MKVHAIIVAAGLGTRVAGDIPKQFRMLGGRKVYEWSLKTFLRHDAIDSVCLVLPKPASVRPAITDSKLITTSGGENRSQSVRNGLAAIGARDDDIILIHDAARPGLAASHIDDLLAALDQVDAAAPALPVSDALKRQTGTLLETVERNGLYRMQTPQAFRASFIIAALNRPDADYVDDLAAVEELGVTVKLIGGDIRLDKITYEKDFKSMAQLLDLVSAPVRVGSGYDVHRFAPGDHVTICGLKIPHDQSLQGHSDADVGWHALTDAIFGALALGDLGDHFPPSDPKWKGADSGIFLTHSLQLASDKGWALDSCDITIICEAPKVKPHRDAMRKRTAELTGLSIDQISIKATTTEGLGFAGRKEGIAAQAIATLCQKRP